MKNFYVTTTLPYVNAEPHIGFALEIIEADVLARFHTLKGDQVIFNTGTDEHGIKIYRKALERGQDPQDYVDEYAKKFDLLKQVLNLSYTNFIRTTETHHQAAAQEFWKRCWDRGDIYKKQYQIKYCVGCELDKTDSELENGKCPMHPSYELELIDEENYFFRFSRYQMALLDLYKNDKEFVQPDYRLKEIKNFVEAGLADFSISRLKAKMPWGVPVPNDPDHVMYVWFDALVNYISTLGWPTDQKRFEEFWPGVQFCGKDNLRQQAAMWQAMLLSAELPTSKCIYVHGFITSDGKKMSKSVGNVVDPIEICKKYGTDAVRYYLSREISFGEDGDYSDPHMQERYNTDLGNTLGNLINRVIVMSKKYFDGGVPKVMDHAAPAGRQEAWIIDCQTKLGVEEAYQSSHCDKALEAIWKSLFQANKLIEETQPFKLIKTDPNQVAKILYALLEACRWYAWMVAPVMPDTANRVFTQLGLEAKDEMSKGWDQALTWGQLVPGTMLGDPEPLFPRHDQS